MPGVFRDLHKLEWLYVPAFITYITFYFFFLPCGFFLLLSGMLVSECGFILCKTVFYFWCICFYSRILENNSIHQISSTTFSGLNSLVLLWVIISTFFCCKGFLGVHFGFFTSCDVLSNHQKWCNWEYLAATSKWVFFLWTLRERPFTLFHVVLLIDRVLLNNSLTNLDDICREMPRLNWL